MNINETRSYWVQLALFAGTGDSGNGSGAPPVFPRAFTERKPLVFDLGDAEHHDRRAEGGW